MSRPYTVKFGPWLPDLSNVGVEMPMQWTETELPTADCLNVFYADSSYRCLPSLASFGPTLGTPILDAFSWYDDTAGKEIVFAATANGFSQLEDGAWTAIPLQVNASAGTVGLALSIALGSPFACAVYLSPSSQSATSGTSSYVFGGVTAVCGNGTPSGYSWSFSGATGPGSWSLASGAGTSVAAPQVTGSTSGSTSTATLNCAITVNGNTYTASSTLSYTELNPLLHSYTSGSGTETVPAGYANVVIEVKGGGGGYSDTSATLPFLAGGGGAGYCRSTYAVTGGQTINYVVGTAGGINLNGNGTLGQPSTASSGTLSITTMTANGGGGANANGAGGTASGGNQANATGSNGVNGGGGGLSTAGVNFDTGDAYGKGGAYNSGGETGGFVSFYYTS